jgi:Ca-activated chloride channel family protein
MRKLLLSLLFALVLVLAIGFPAGAQTDPPEFIFPRDLHIAYQRVDVSIDNQVATTRIDQLFVNDNDFMMEGTYLFPLPEGAAVTELTMWVDGVPIEAKVLGAEEARNIYDTIVRQMRDPALLEYVGTSAIQANVFPIPANAERRIEIEYTQVLPAENGLIHYLYPQSTDLYTNLPLDSQSIRVEIASRDEIRTVYSPSHAVAIDRPDAFHAVAGYEAQNVQPDRDFELFYSVTADDIGLNLLTFKEPGEDGFFLLLVAPTVEVDPDEVIAKDVLLVIDTSGSMHGEKLAQAQEAARFVVDNLNPQDQFNIISFSTGTRNFAPELVPASEPGDTDSFINSLEAIGGTNISQALLEAYNQMEDDRPATIIFLTDGLPTEGIVDTPLLLNTFEQSAPDNARLFAFGVGYDVDTFLLDSLAENHRGTTTYVRPEQDISEVVSSFYAKVSTPVLANIGLDFGDIVVEQLYPPELPDLFAGTQLVLTGRYREGGPATITLRGEVNGQEETFAYEDNTFRTSGGDDFIPRLWATRAIGHLLTQIRLHGENTELVQSVVNLSIRYGIITPYTSYLIEEDDIFSEIGRRTITEEAEAEFAFPRLFSGEDAVEEAAAERNLSAAEAPIEVTRVVVETVEMEVQADGEPAGVQEAVQQVGSKTFVWRNGVWMDTAYDADTMTPEEVGFATDTYFDLLTAAPELGQYLAIGEQVLVVYRDVAYQIVTGEGDREVTLPVISNSDDDPANPSNSGASAETDNKLSTGTCTAAMIFPLFMGVLAAGFGLRLRRKKGD